MTIQTQKHVHIYTTHSIFDIHTEHRLVSKEIWYIYIYNILISYLCGSTWHSGKSQRSRHCPRSPKKESQWWKLQGLIEIVKITDGGENMKECEKSVKSEPHPLAVTQWHWVKSGRQKRQLGCVQATPGMHVDFFVFRKDKDWHYKCWKHCQPCFYTWPSTTFHGCMKPTRNGVEPIHVFMSLPSLMINILSNSKFTRIDEVIENGRLLQNNSTPFQREEVQGEKP